MEDDAAAGAGVEQEIEVDDARAFGRCGGAVAAHDVLDGEEAVEEVEGRERGIEQGGGVEEVRLVKVADGGGGVEGGDGGDVAEVGEAVEGFAEIGVGWSEAGGEVGAEGDGGGHAGVLRVWRLKEASNMGWVEIFGVLRLRCAPLRMTGFGGDG